MIGKLKDISLDIQMGLLSFLVVPMIFATLMLTDYLIATIYSMNGVFFALHADGSINLNTYEFYALLYQFYALLLGVTMIFIRGGGSGSLGFLLGTMVQVCIVTSLL